MVAPVATQRHALASAFAEFTCLPDLLARIPLDGHFYSPVDHVDFGPGDMERLLPQVPAERRPRPILAVRGRGASGSEAGGFRVRGCLGAGVAAPTGRSRTALAPDGRALADIGAARSLPDRTAHDHNILRQVLARQVERNYLGARQLPIVPLLQDAARELGQVGLPGGGTSSRPVTR